MILRETELAVPDALPEAAVYTDGVCDAIREPVGIR
jgi:hypothetical protein